LKQPLLASARRTVDLALLLGGAGLLLAGVGPTLVLGVGALVYAVAVFCSPAIAVPLIVATLPFHLHPRTVAGQELSLAELAILLGCCASGLRWMWVSRAQSRSPRPQASNTVPAEATSDAIHAPTPASVDWLVGAFIAVALASLLVTDYPKQSLRALRWLVIEPIAVYYLVRMTLATERQVWTLLWAIIATGAAAAVIGLGSIMLDGNLLRFAVRANDPYLSPNHLGIFLGRTGAVALAVILFARPSDQRSRFLAGGALGTVLLALTRTLSLGAWAGMVAAALTLGALKNRRAVVLTVAALVVLGAATLAVLPHERTFGRLDPTTGTALFRVEIWRSALHMIADHPLLGLGMDNFLYAYQDGYMRPEAWREPNISHPHNWVLDFWIQLGISGLITACALIVWTIRACGDLLRSADTLRRIVGAGALGAAVDLLVHGFVDNSYFLVDSATIWWIFVGLLTVLRTPASQAAEAGAYNSVIPGPLTAVGNRGGGAKG
jgi:O-antigen ligase